MKATADNCFASGFILDLTINWFLTLKRFTGNQEPGATKQGISLRDLGKHSVSSDHQQLSLSVRHHQLVLFGPFSYPTTRYTKMKTATNIYIFNLALADALATSTLPFQSAKYLMSTWPFGELLCKVVIAIDYYNMFTSIFTLTMMSVDRYIAVCHPVRALDFRTPAKAKLINVCIWVLSSAVGVPVMIIAVTEGHKGRQLLLFQEELLEITIISPHRLIWQVLISRSV